MVSRKIKFSLSCYLNKAKMRKGGEAPIIMRININGEKLTMQLQRNVNPEIWDPKSSRAIGRNAEARSINEYIETMKLKARMKYNELLQKHDSITPQLLRDAIMGINTSRAIMLIEVWDEELARMHKLLGKETTKATCQKYRTARNHVQAFIQAYYRSKDISVKQINHKFVTDLTVYLKTDGGCGHNTTIKFLQTFKRIILICSRNGWITKDPFVGIPLRLREVERPYLTEDELQRLMDFHSPIERINRVKDFFVFSCFTGLAYADVKKLRRREIERDDSGYWIRTKRQKTGARSHIPLLEAPLRIINKYNDLSMLLDDDPVLPILSNQKMNAYLKELADMCSITKTLSFHIARHTFATTVTMTNGVPMESVSKMLGHKNLRSTQHYARIVDQKVGDDMTALAGKLNSKLRYEG